MRSFIKVYLSTVELIGQRKQKSLQKILIENWYGVFKLSCWFNYLKRKNRKIANACLFFLFKCKLNFFFRVQVYLQYVEVAYICSPYKSIIPILKSRLHKRELSHIQQALCQNIFPCRLRKIKSMHSRKCKSARKSVSHSYNITYAEMNGKVFAGRHIAPSAQTSNLKLVYIYFKVLIFYSVLVFHA